MEWWNPVSIGASKYGVRYDPNISREEKIRNKQRRWRATHREKHNQLMREWLKKNKGKSAVYKSRWKAKHPDKARAKRKRYYERHKDKWKIREARRRAHKIGRSSSLSYEEWGGLLRKYDYRCLCCGKKEPEITLTLDHIIPIFMGGTSDIDNIQPLCSPCNKKKGKKIIDYRKVIEGGSS